MLSKFFLKRPVFAWVIAIFIMLLGCLAIYNLPVAQYPNLAPPSISISAFYPGASAETVENSVTQVIEQNMTGLDGLLYMSSTSDSAGQARLELTFAPGVDVDVAWTKVQNRLQPAMASLPDVVQRGGVLVNKSTRNFMILVGLIASMARCLMLTSATTSPQTSKTSSPASPASARVGALPRIRYARDDIDRLNDFNRRRTRSYNVKCRPDGDAPAVEGQPQCFHHCPELVADTRGIRRYPNRITPQRVVRSRHRSNQLARTHISSEL